MCNLSQSVWEQGEAKGIEKGIETGIETGRKQGFENGLLVSLKNLMANMNLSIDEAMNVVEDEDIPF